mgnify:CR=1 FL=1
MVVVIFGAYYSANKSHVTSSTASNAIVSGVGESVDWTVHTGEYTVQRGDSFWGIARDYNTSVNTLQEINNKDNYWLYVGEHLIVPQYITGKLTVPSPQPEPEPEPTPVQGLTAAEQKMVNLVNKERTSRGLPALKVDMELVNMARDKSQDMIANNYFAHQSPTYGSPFDMMKSYGINYTYAGENIAGASTVEIAHNALMKSQGHRENILRKEFTHIGIGIIEGGRYGMMFSQEFIRK